MKIVRQFVGGAWLSNRELAAQLPDVSYHTIRAHTQRLAHLGVLRTAAVAPGRRYQLAATRRATQYVQRITAAATVFGLSE